MVTVIHCPPQKAPKLPTVGVPIKTLGEHKRAFLNANNRKGWPVEEVDVGLNTVLEESKPTEKYAEVIQFLLDKLYGHGFASKGHVYYYLSVLRAVTNNELEDAFLYSMIATRFGYDRWDECLVVMSRGGVLNAKAKQLKNLIGRNKKNTL